MRGVEPPADLAEYHAAALAGYETFLDLVASPEEGGGLDVGTAPGDDPAGEAYVRESCLAGDPEAFAAVFHEGLRGLAAGLALFTPPD